MPLKGFFAAIQPSQTPTSIIPRCGACGLYKRCQSPRMPYTGKGRKGILIVAEAPGKNEDLKGIQLIGKAGQHLRKSLRKFKVDLDADCWKTNALICHPGGEKPEDKRVLACRPNLLKTLDELKPRTIILLGAHAVKSLIGKLWREDVGAIGRWVGWQIPSQELGAWVCPTYHPSYLLRQNDPALQFHFDKHLKAAVELEGRPPKGTDYRKQVKVIQSPEIAAGLLWDYLKKEGLIAFDYETNGLKPEPSWSEIVSCSVCWEGEETISFPWEGIAVRAMGELLRSSKVGKIAQNMKFEQRWTQAKLGHGVRNWKWDTMIAAHVLDNRPGVTGLKFQAFARLGVGSYDDHIGPYLKSKGEGQPNRVREIPLRELLLYGGIDSAVTWDLAQLQMKEIRG